MPASSFGGFGRSLGEAVDRGSPSRERGDQNNRARRDRRTGGSGEGTVKRPLDGSGVETKDSVTTPKASRKSKAREEEGSEVRQSRKLRRGRRARLLASVDDGLGNVSIRRAQGRVSRLLGS